MKNVSFTLVNKYCYYKVSKFELEDLFLKISRKSSVKNT